MTKFEYACFISYRNSRLTDGLISSFARELAFALEQYLDAHLIDDIQKNDNNYMVFLDKHVIKSGDFLPNLLGQGLCKSMCWIIVYTPNYLRGALWCASELNTMLRLQEERIKRLSVGKQSKPFIIPIMLRGSQEDVPTGLRNYIANQDFRKYLLSHTNIGRHELWAPIIDELASIIAERQRLIRKHEEKRVNLCENCNDCAVVDVTVEDGYKEIESFLQSMLDTSAPKPEMPLS